MKKDKLSVISEKLTERLLQVDYTNLPISDYNKRYIAKLYPALSYYMKIYTDCLLKGIKVIHLDPADIVLVDYGGGSGFLSILAKEVGIGRVIYIDLNPLSVDTVKTFKKEIGTGPDEILCGSSDVLAEWCTIRKIKPHLLIATDLIEHIYHLQSFFNDLHKVNDQMAMIFTTGSTPYNPIVKRRLHKYMSACETGQAVLPNYYTKRKTFIKEHYPNLFDEQIDVWSECTRGLIYEDIRKAIDDNRLPIPDDKHNTCDPETGNWTERILPIKTYKSILAPYNYKVRVAKGYFNTRRENPFSRLISKCINCFIKISGPVGLFFAPFIFLLCIPDKINESK